MTAECGLCPHKCRLEEGQTGRCRGRVNRGGRVTCGNYGQLTSLALDPVEKKPFARFYPGSFLLSAGSYGCNLDCPFCQNASIAFASRSAQTISISPERLLSLAQDCRRQGNIGIAFTYNEPLISYEYILDCAVLFRREGMKTAVVTNGTINPEPLEGLLPFLDAMNIDLKGFTPEWYRKLGGELETVKECIRIASKSCHVEVTTLIVPGENDSPEEMEALSAWLALVRPDIPLHISRFFPRRKYGGKQPTPPDTIRKLAGIAGERLKYVYMGNM